ncbi:hypothetical protein BpHYR1_004631 [Brachionus plicatilis]|uniref:Uncharacterized protein n=1 Tax=Brachionus plicatilis TaxID=10195 RepID=A0A3M7S7Z3_BRAPC|nr:hypothetical protein BpHYR1_004631 [Brachionus plicatilis]
MIYSKISDDKELKFKSFANIDELTFYMNLQSIIWNKVKQKTSAKSLPRALANSLLELYTPVTVITKPNTIMATLVNFWCQTRVRRFKCR